MNILLCSIGKRKENSKKFNKKINIVNLAIMVNQTVTIVGVDS
jgi:hypothetical protein